MTTIFIALATITAAYSIFSVLLMSDFGQFFGLPKSWIVTYYRHRWLFGGINVALLAWLWFLHLAYGQGPLWLLVFATVGVSLCIVASNVINVYLFPTQNRNATFVPVAEAEALFDDDQTIYVLDINGDVRGYPQDHLEVPHVAGGTVGGEDVAMTYCGLSNLPVAMGDDVATGKANVSVMAQVNNNLVLRDHASGELVQQITARTEFGGKHLTVYPNTMMSWRSFKELYPHGQVFVYPLNRWLDPMIKWFFAQTLKIQNDREKGAAFPTLSMKDRRLNPKERVWGYDAGGKQVAFTRAFAVAHPNYRFEVAGEPLVLVHDATHDIVTLFSRLREGEVVEFQSVDFRGRTGQGQLDQKPLHNGVYWMVWSHWFPGTDLLDA